jgi:hypothetical protein
LASPKGTAIYSGTDIDLFLSLRPETPNNLKDIYQTLFNAMEGAGYAPKKQNVSINIKVGAYNVDLVPAQRHDNVSSDHLPIRCAKLMTVNRWGFLLRATVAASILHAETLRIWTGEATRVH